MNHFVVKVAFREIGASICHDFSARNLKREYVLLPTVSGHSLDLLLGNTMTLT